MMKPEDFDKITPTELNEDIIPKLLMNQKKLEVFYQQHQSQKIQKPHDTMAGF